MKHFLATILLTVGIAHSFEIPKGSHNIAQLDDAVVKAAKAKQPIAFLITDKAFTAT